MPEPDAFDALTTRFAQLGRADRDAVLAALAPGEREQVLAAIARQAEARRDPAVGGRSAGRRYAAYSPWLAAIVRQAVEGDAMPDPVGERARQAIVAAHGSAGSDQAAPAESLWTQVRRLGERLIDGEPRPR